MLKYLDSIESYQQNTQIHEAQRERETLPLHERHFSMDTNKNPT